jgi:hypothetical protein
MPYQRNYEKNHWLVNVNTQKKQLWLKGKTDLLDIDHDKGHL